MAYVIPTCEPTELGVGDSWEWDRVVGDWPPSDGYTLTYYFNGPSAFSVAASASGSGDYYEVRVPPETSASRAAGNYQIIGYVAKAGARYRVYGPARIEVTPDLATSAAALAHAERMLALCEAVLEGRAEPDMKRFEIAGRVVEREDLTAWRSLRTQYALEVAALRNPQGTPFRQIQATFPR